MSGNIAAFAEDVSSSAINSNYVIVGGGVAGVSCAEQLSIEDAIADVTLISSSPLVKVVRNVTKISERLEEFEVEEKSFASLENFSNCRVIRETVVELDCKKHEVILSSGLRVRYKKLCISSGAQPKVISENCPFVIGIRDTETVQAFQERLVDAVRVLVVGNGGIATELVYEIENCQVIWAIKDKSVGATFFDAGAAHFFLPCLEETKRHETTAHKRMQYKLEDAEQSGTKQTTGSALGPDWSAQVNLKGKGEIRKNVHVEYECEVQKIYETASFQKSGLQETLLGGACKKEVWPVYVQLTNGSVYGCDFIISATGVIPNVKPFLNNNQLNLGGDCGILIDDQMSTSEVDVFAAGDVCTANWPLADHWFQMRLWTQARQMGAYAAKCMACSLRGENMTLDICFDLFTHVTRFFGYKVILLGLFNGQKLGTDYEMFLRISERHEYVKVVMQRGKMQGAILIGETDLEETFENLILNQLDLSAYGEDILNPNVDIEDYFD